MLNRYTILLVLVGLLIAYGYFREWQDRQRFEARLDFLSSDAHVVVGDRSLVLPVVALPDFSSMGQVFTLNRAQAARSFQERQDAFREKASDPLTAPELDKLRVYIGAYGWNISETRDIREFSIPKFCKRLSRGWAQSVCDNPWAPLQQSLPETFHLADRRSLEVFDSYWTVGKERRSDQLRAMPQIGAVAETACDHEDESRRQFCTAAIQVSGNLIAVWNVWESDHETSSQRAKRQGRAIAAFVQYGLGDTEDYQELRKMACDAVKPDHSKSPNPLHETCSQS
ncbi:hypothetical protein SAMN05444404_2893 [Ruegeria lacuscaerulensis ITI-1157]|nr:hypothetical protein SAMN05444404_2893 [Ruegeria lacuscaerulensis ITI-1157]